MNSANQVVAKFGGVSALANLLGKGPTTVQYWTKVGTIPAKWHAQLLALARQEGIELYPGDFIDDPDSSMEGLEDVPPPLPVAEWQGTLVLGDLELPAYVLSNGQRVISRSGATGVLMGKKGDGNLESYLTVQALKSYMPAKVSDLFIEFAHPGVVHKNVAGMTAETFIDICTAYVRGLDENQLETDRQKEIALKAAMFLAACSKVGLVALIDEATGYQYARAEDALQVKLRAFLADEMRKWEPTFPEELWQEFGRLTRWEGSIHHRPKYWGNLVMELIYGYLDKDVAEWLKKNNPKPHKGQNHHQWLSSQYGLRKLIEHIWMVIGLARACGSMPELKARLAQLYGRRPEYVQVTLWVPDQIPAPKLPERKSLKPRPTAERAKK